MTYKSGSRDPLHNPKNGTQRVVTDPTDGSNHLLQGTVIRSLTPGPNILEILLKTFSFEMDLKLGSEEGDDNASLSSYPSVTNDSYTLGPCGDKTRPLTST